MSKAIAVRASLMLALAASSAAAALPHLGREAKMERRATGTFDVTLSPVSGSDGVIGAMTIAKTFHGDVKGTSTGQMLAIRTATPGSAGYVAMERVTATLGGRHGSFDLQHSGSMNRGAQSLSVTVIPDSGTDGLQGLAGTMDIIVADGRHDYVFRYTLP